MSINVLYLLRYVYLFLYLGDEVMCGSSYGISGLPRHFAPRNDEKELIGIFTFQISCLILLVIANEYEANQNNYHPKQKRGDLVIITRLPRHFVPRNDEKELIGNFHFPNFLSKLMR
jgi:hypothetical protein